MKRDGGLLCVPNEWMDYGSVVYLGSPHLSNLLHLTPKLQIFPMKKESPETIDFPQKTFFPSHSHTQGANRKNQERIAAKLKCPEPQHFPFQPLFFCVCRKKLIDFD